MSDTAWHRWHAWRPVFVGWSIVWLRQVWRRRVYCNATIEGTADSYWEYAKENPCFS